MSTTRRHGERLDRQVSATRRRVHIVPHTHWDREWYLPFQTFRLRLVDLLDDLLPRLEADPSTPTSCSTGSSPSSTTTSPCGPRPRPASAASSAAAASPSGPWYTLPDEFLVVGRDARARPAARPASGRDRFGGAMEVGYLPDMFGHVAQMPQLLRRLRLRARRRVAGRARRGRPHGVPVGGARRHEVRAEYLPARATATAPALPDDAKALVAPGRRVRRPAGRPARPGPCCG